MSDMKRYLKIVLCPLVILVRGIRKLRKLPCIRTRQLFTYDRRQFAKYAGCFHPECKTAALARIIMAYHVLEKGLTMPHRHLDFGHAAVLGLIERIEEFERKFGVAEEQVSHAIGCVKEYYELHASSAFDMSRDESYWEKIRTFCENRSRVAPARQIEMTREEFFAYNDSPFPVFAASRHTSRHYDGAIEIEEIKKAVQLAMTAPSACNRQFVKVYCVSNHEIRDRILALQNGNRGFGHDADKLLVVTADLCGNRWPEERNDLYTNAGIFTMNLCYSLHYHKIAHCILNWSVPPENDLAAHKVLGLPPNELIAVILSCGRAPESFQIASSPRKSIDDIFSEVK